MGLTITLTLTGQTGKILGTFGKSGKLKVRLETEIPEEKMEEVLGSEVTLKYKKSIWQEKGKKQKNKFKFN